MSVYEQYTKGHFFTQEFLSILKLDFKNRYTYTFIETTLRNLQSIDHNLYIQIIPQINNLSNRKFNIRKIIKTYVIQQMDDYVIVNNVSNNPISNLTININ